MLQRSDSDHQTILKKYFTNVSSIIILKTLTYSPMKVSSLTTLPQHHCKKHIKLYAVEIKEHQLLQ